MPDELIVMEKIGLIATLTLNRPHKRNAMHQPLIMALAQALTQLSADESRVLLIKGQGEHFCAGGDIAWMQKIALHSPTENVHDAKLLADLLYQLYTFPKPTIVLTHGAVLGGGMGLLAAADMALSAKNATFGFPEVKIGITPSMISPYVVSAMGERAANYYFLTGEHFNATEACEMGLVHRVTEEDALIDAGMALAQTIAQNSPQALKAAKQLLRGMAKEKITEQLTQKTAEHLAELRATPQAQEGLHAFLEKRKPAWE